MEKNIKQKNCKFVSWLIFSFNLLAAGLIVLGIKHQDEKRLESDSFSQDLAEIPVDQKLLNSQNMISTDRENKLRGLNTDPKELKQVDTTTTTTTTTTVVQQQPKADTKTKSS